MAVPVSESIAFSVGITMACVYAVGRFQPPTIGHESMIREVIAKAKDLNGKAYIFISSQTTPKDQNPFSVETKKAFLEKVFSPEDVTFVDTSKCGPDHTGKCGGPLAAWGELNRLGCTSTYLVAGTDRAPIFDPKLADKPKNLWAFTTKPPKDGETPTPPPTFIESKRDITNGMSGTKARGFAKAGNFSEFMKAVNIGGRVEEADARVLYDLLAPGAKKGGTDTPESLDLSSFAADAEPKQGGRRRTYRRCRRCGLPIKTQTT
jgi:hypothetical protein